MKKIILLLKIFLLPAIAFSQVNLAAGTNIVTSGNVHIVVSDLDFKNYGTLYATGSTFHFTGLGDNSINGDAVTFNNITVNKPTGKQLTLHATLYVDGQVNFTSGNIELNDKYIFLGSTGSLVGEREASRATSSSSGLINITGVLNAPNAVNIGNIGVLITSSANLGNVSITRTFDSQNLPTGGGKSILRNFEIFPSVNTGLNATVTMKYFDAELNGLDESKLTQFERDGNFVYADKNYSARDAAANYVTQTGYNNLYKFTLSIPAIALPVTLTKFTAQCKGAFITLNWTTATEQNSDRFEVQRNINGTNWNKIGSVKAAGNSNGSLSYQYDDKALNAPSAFYRLAQYDKDGKATYSTIVKAGCGGSTEFTVMPNPVSTVAKVVIGSRGTNTGMLQLFNAAGQQVYQQAIKLSAGLNQYEINTTPLPGGAYNLIFTQAGAQAQTMRLLKQ